MAAKRKVITSFLEDKAQELFIGALVDRIAHEVGVTIKHDDRSVVHGGRPLAELKQFLRDETRRGVSSTDLLVVSIDGNCKGYNEKRAQIAHLIQHSHYAVPYVCAIPDPHIERWYLCDGDAVRQALSENVQPIVPQYKCERDRYKRELQRVIKEAGIESYFGGVEYGQEIVAAMDFAQVGKTDTSLIQFVEDLRAALRSLSAAP